MNTHTTVTGCDIKSDHYRGLKVQRLTRKRQEVMDAALLAHAQGKLDFTANELCGVMAGQLGKRVVPSDITSSVDELIKSGLLAANYHHGRACSITGSTKVRTLYAVARQADLRLAPAKSDIQGAVSSTATASKSCASSRLDTMRARLAALQSARQAA